MRIAIGSDHAGFAMKQAIVGLLAELGHSYKDFGCFNSNSVDYPDIAQPVAEAVYKKSFDRGILICSTGIGMSIVANKVPGIRAALCHNSETAKLSREHNDANVLTFGARIVDEDTAKEMVKVWLKTDFLGDRHLRRVNKMKDVEKKYNK